MPLLIEQMSPAEIELGDRLSALVDSLDMTPGDAARIMAFILGVGQGMEHPAAGPVGALESLRAAFEEGYILATQGRPSIN